MPEASRWWCEECEQFIETKWAEATHVLRQHRGWRVHISDQMIDLFKAEGAAEERAACAALADQWAKGLEGDEERLQFTEYLNKLFASGICTAQLIAKGIRARGQHPKEAIDERS